MSIKKKILSKKRTVFSFLFITIFLFSCNQQKSHFHKSSSHADPDSVITGAQVLLQSKKDLNKLKGKRVGLVMNSTAQVAGVPMVDTLLSLGVNVTTLFGPEHGFRSQAGAGESIKNGIDTKTGLPVYSLYGKHHKPTLKELQNVDILLFDMKDLAAHFYTFNTTLGLVIEAAADAGIPVWVLDRPIPAGGNYVAGWTLEKKYKSFVGYYPVPMVYGMTQGELARMMIGEHWIKYDKKPKLRVIEMEGWKRSMKWPEVGLKWYPPSPNLPHFQNAYVYLGTVLFEASNISTGRGTSEPFLTIGSPKTDLSGKDLKKLRHKFPAITIDSAAFIPRSIPGKSLHPRYEGQTCYGVRLHVHNLHKFHPLKFGLALLRVMLKDTPGAHTTSYIYELAGTRAVDSLKPDWQQDVKKFKKERKKYLIYK
jgi:uncharacterized protein YbbC (DUF1343 family)